MSAHQHLAFALKFQGKAGARADQFLKTRRQAGEQIAGVFFIEGIGGFDQRFELFLF